MYRNPTTGPTARPSGHCVGHRHSTSTDGHSGLAAPKVSEKDTAMGWFPWGCLCTLHRLDRPGGDSGRQDPRWPAV